MHGLVWVHGLVSMSVMVSVWLVRVHGLINVSVRISVRVRCECKG